MPFTIRLVSSNLVAPTYAPAHYRSRGQALQPLAMFLAHKGGQIGHVYIVPGGGAFKTFPLPAAPGPGRHIQEDRVRERW